MESDSIVTVSGESVLQQEWQASSCMKRRLGIARAFTVTNLLTHQECDEIIRLGHEVGFVEIVASSSYRRARTPYVARLTPHCRRRNHQRAMFRSCGLSEALYSRLSQFVDQPELEIVDEADAELYDCEGTWDVCRASDMLRVMRYVPNDHLGPHCDGFERKSDDEVSMFTVLVYVHDRQYTQSKLTRQTLRYLNDGAQGGRTNFVRAEELVKVCAKLVQLPRCSSGSWQNQDLSTYAASEDSILESVTPEKGMALVFYHRTMHEGERVLQGEKYILRSDLFYRRRAGTRKELTEVQRESRREFEAAEKAEADGRLAEALQHYKRAIRLDPELARLKGLC
jgi:hypothetical protein